MSRLAEALERADLSQYTAGSPADGQSAPRKVGAPQAWDLDGYDPDLAVDDLSEFLPVESHPDVTSMLSVSTLHEFFVEEPTEPTANGRTIDTSTPPSRHAELAASGPFGDRDASTVADDDRARGQDVVVVDVVEEPGFESEIQRAAADFQRFAEQFHAFASQCEHRRGV